MVIFFGKYTPKYVQDFMLFACKELKIDGLRGKVFVDTRHKLEDDCFGLCHSDGRFIQIELATHVLGEKVTREDRLKTAAHELTHAKQYLTKKMRPSQKLGTTIWKNQRHYHPRSEYSAPWEIQARRWEEILYQRYINKGK